MSSQKQIPNELLGFPFIASNMRHFAKLAYLKFLSRFLEVLVPRNKMNRKSCVRNCDPNFYDSFPAFSNKICAKIMKFPTFIPNFPTFMFLYNWRRNILREIHNFISFILITNLQCFKMHQFRNENLKYYYLTSEARKQSKPIIQELITKNGIFNTQS